MGYNSINGRACVVRRATDQVITTATATAVSWSNAIVNNNALAEFVTNPTRITVDHEGLYEVFGNVTFAAGSTGVRTLQVKKNGVASTFPLEANGPAPAAGTGKLQVSGLVYLLNGDYLELIVTQNQGGDVNITADTTALSPSFGVVMVWAAYDPSANAESI